MFYTTVQWASVIHITYYSLSLYQEIKSTSPYLCAVAKATNLTEAVADLESPSVTCPLMFRTYSWLKIRRRFLLLEWPPKRAFCNPYIFLFIIATLNPPTFFSHPQRRYNFMTAMLLLRTFFLPCLDLFEIQLESKDS